MFSELDLIKHVGLVHGSHCHVIVSLYDTILFLHFD